MNVIPTAIEGVLILEPRVFGDDRGYFFESFSAASFREQVCSTDFVQDNESFSRYGVVRGSVLDVAVDIRRGSKTFGQHVAVELSERNHRQLFIPRGFAHGFSVLSPEVIFQYKCDNYYAPDSEGAIAWDDPELAIDWRIPADHVILSEKDKHHPRLSEAKLLFDIEDSLY